MSEYEKDQAQKIDVEDLEVSAEASREIKGGAGSHGTGAGGGKVSMQDFHFVMRQNSASPK